MEILGHRPRFIVVGPRPDEVQLTPAGRLLHDALAREYAPVKGDDAPARPDIYERLRLTARSGD
jgi:hypothetical protein